MSPPPIIIVYLSEAVFTLAFIAACAAERWTMVLSIVSLYVVVGWDVWHCEDGEGAE